MTKRASNSRNVPGGGGEGGGKQKTKNGRRGYTSLGTRKSGIGSDVTAVCGLFNVGQ